MHSTPLTGLVGQAGEAERDALERDVVAEWQRFEADGGFLYRQPIVVGTARK